MNWLKQNWLKIGIGIVILGVLFFTKEWRDNPLSISITNSVASFPSTITPSFEPQIYLAQVIQVGGIGSDIYTNRAYYFGDGTADQEGWPNYLDKNIYAGVSFNTPFYLMYLGCKDGYIATTESAGSFSLDQDINGNSQIFGIELKDQLRNEIAIKCQKP